MYWRNRNTPAACEGDVNGNCIGAGGPEIFYLNSVNFALGNNFNSPQGRDIHRFPISNNTTWQKGRHSVKFGGTWEPSRPHRLLGVLRSGARRICCRRSSSSRRSAESGRARAVWLACDGRLRNQADLLRLPVVDVHSGHWRSRAAVVQPRRRAEQRSVITFTCRTAGRRRRP